MTVAYKAFITYSHADTKFVSWLQKKLETYKVPRRLVGKETARGQVPARLRPVFRDREELSAGSDLSETISTALRNAEFLICVCSPSARASEWVNKEISEFRQHHGDERIVCVIVDGAPYASAQPGTADMECFPPALGLKGSDTGTASLSSLEHVAADMRPSADGRRGAFLKIVAGLIGVRLDDLVQRDAQRRSRFWAGVAGSSLVLAAAMIGLALYALDARQESELRRGQAENLIGFMLGDLRQGLQPIGRLDLLDAVGDEAMQYFEALDDNATPRDLLSRSMALRQIGEVRFFQGQLDTSLSAFLESRSVLQRLVAKDEAVDDYLFELGQSEFWVGYVHYERAEFDQALQAMNRYMEISRDLVSRQPGNPDFVTELGYAWSNLGSVADGRGDKAQAISYFREAASISEGQLVDDPANASLRDDVAGSYSWIGEAEMDLQNLDAADDALSIAFDQYDALAREEDNVRYLERRASVGALLTELFVKRERYEDAYERASETYEEFAKLIAHDPTNSRWKRQYAMSASDLAKAAYHTERRDLVDELLAESMRHFDELIATDASNQEWQDARREIEVLKQRLQSSMQP